MNTRENAGYTIISSVRINARHEIVIGHNENAPGAFVCWYCEGGNNYHTGAYFNNYPDALARLIERVKGSGII